MFVHVFLLFPETAGKTLEETKSIFEDPNGPKYIGTLAWKTGFDRHATILEYGGFDPESKAAFKHVEDGEKSVAGDASGNSETEGTAPPS